MSIHASPRTNDPGVKNPVFHSKTKHIEIRHHFIKDANEKKLIQMIKIHTDHNVADLLIKAFDVGRFQYLIATANDEIQVSTVGLPYYWSDCRKVGCLCCSKIWAPGMDFGKTATVRTVDNGEQEITATVDGKEFTITEASVRRHLQLADIGGISVLPTTKIFDQLSLMGNIKRGFSGEHTPLFPSMLAIQAEEVEGNRVQGGSLDANEAWVSLAQTRLRGSGGKLGCVKKGEKTIKTSHSRRRAKIVVSDDEENSSKQGRMIAEIDQDAGVTLVTPTQGENQPENQLGVLSAAKVLVDAAKTYTR
ncbi:hypothetical protein Tco_1538702 [Tanacetum coccineum]